MGFILKKEEIQIIREAMKNGTGRIPEMMKVLHKRVHEDISNHNILDSINDVKWIHVMEGRLSEAGFVNVFMPDEALASWIRESVLTVVRMPMDVWIGAEFRARTDPPYGSLETSHLCVGIVNAVDMNPDLFTPEEMAEIKQALLDKGMYLTKNWIERNYQPEKDVTNWFTVLLTSLVVISAFLDLEEEVDAILEMYEHVSKLFNKDSYGEPVGYWSYAAVHMVEIREYVSRYKKELGEKLNTDSYANCIPWAVASFLRMQKLKGWEDPLYPLSLNFGDSAYIRRMHAKLLLSVACTEKEKNPKLAGLSRWLFEEQYPVGTLTFCDKEMGNNEALDFWTPFFYATAAEPLSPEEVGLEAAMCFETGDVIIRDSWADTKMVLGIRGGYVSLNTDAHRHEDLNSFILSYGKEEFFIDPGHCCYRLSQYKLCKETGSHNTWQLEKDGELIGQKKVKGCFTKVEKPYSKQLDFRTENDVVIYSADAAEAYGEIARKAIRTFAVVSPNLILIRDDVDTVEEVKLKTNFHLNNFANDLEYSAEIDERTVKAIRGQKGCKLVQIGCYADGSEAENELSNTWGIMHVNYHPYPNHRCQGLEGSMVDYHYLSKEAARKHTCIYAIMMDEASEISEWTIEKQGTSVKITNGVRAWEVLSDAVSTVVRSDKACEVSIR